MKWVYQFKLGVSKEPIVITGTDFNDVFKKVGAHYSSFGFKYNAESLRRSIMRQNDSAARNQKRLKLSDVIKGANALIRYSAGSAVNNQEIQRRSNICLSCPELAETSDCMSCGGAGKLASFINAIRSSKGKEVNIPQSIKNKYCGICGCSCSLLVVTKHSDLKEESEAHQQLRPTHCWMKKNSSNYNEA